jgi:hypothetical protein
MIGPFLKSRTFAYTMLGCLVPYFFFALFRQAQFFTETDLNAWRHDSELFVKCLHGERLACSSLSQFPIAYLLNSFFLIKASAMGISVRISLLSINLAFLVCPIFFMVLTRGRKYACVAALLYVAAILSTPIPPFYVLSGALEVQAGVTLGICLSVIGCIKTFSNSNLLWLFLFTALLPFYKDTIVVVVAAAGFLACLAAGRHRRKLSTSAYLAIGAALICSLALVGAYNLLKHQTIFPHSYFLLHSKTSPSLEKSLEFFLGSIFSPNGGVLVFWALSFSVVFIVARLLEITFSRMAILFSVALFAAFLLSNCLWWSPFGWDGWGDRLMIPAGLGSLIFLLCSGNFSAENLPAKPGYPHKLIRIRSLALTAVAAVSFYYVSLSYFVPRERAFQKSLFGPYCSEMVNAIKNRDASMGMEFWRSAIYYRCAGERLWYFPVPD